MVRSQPETRDVQVEDQRITVELAADDEQVADFGKTGGLGRPDEFVRGERSDAGGRVYAGDEGGGGLAATYNVVRMINSDAN